MTAKRISDGNIKSGAEKVKESRRRLKRDKIKSPKAWGVLVVGRTTYFAKNEEHLERLKEKYLPKD